MGSTAQTTQTPTVQELIYSTLLGIQHLDHFPKLKYSFKNELDYYEEKLHAEGPHTTMILHHRTIVKFKDTGDTLATLTCNLKPFGPDDTFESSNNDVALVEPLQQRDG